ncbi:B-type flagellar hook-associated protein 2 [Pseudomonas fluorescens]|uniref:Flagellar hook-associated protein 2 n=1 Tax=Pseudomonas fluorescens TaxID=294 RepID=A0A8H2NR03_PSEFL|nr:flagellar filament capping protein FliD [Pseudomonas fluorescens]VVN86403.1 B-type flagellar hook-associated protein 2 [Pseudomonas fluorescens]VVO84774.1 B-type flagellar hook-associated protein 2 [Pseudomonas fluorescens]
MASPILPGAGLGSGLDTGAIVKALVDSDKVAKQTQIDRQTKINTASLSGIGTLKSVLAAFQTAMKNLGSATTPQFSGFAASSSDVKVVTATSNNSAVKGSYVIKVDNLATSAKVASEVFAGASSAVTEGALTIKLNNKDYVLDVPAGATLQSVRDLINSKFQGDGINANIITDKDGSRLVLGSSATGAGSEISVSGVMTINGNQAMAGDPLDPLAPPGAGRIGDAATDAKFSVDGLSMTSKTNTIDNAVSGLSFNLLAGGGATSTVTVATNTDGLKASIQKFVDAYNAVVTSITSLTKTSLDADGNTVAAALTGDALPRSILAAIRGPLTETGAGDKLTVLAQLGISTNQKTGALDFDSTKFTAAMTDKSLGGEVQAFFTGTGGLLERMDKAIVPYTQTGEILDTRTTNLNKNKANLVEQQAALDRRVATLTAVLTKKYNDMDSLVGKLKATASNITSIFEAMTAQQRNS